MFPTLDMGNLPHEQKETATKIFDHMRHSWKNKFPNTNRKFMINPVAKRSRTQDPESKQSPISQKCKVKDTQTKN